jgi:hypothetical protein
MFPMNMIFTLLTVTGTAITSSSPKDLPYVGRYRHSPG